MSETRENKDGIKVLAAGSILQLFLGILYVWSVFVKPVSETYAWDINSVKLTANFMLSFFVAGILAGGKLQAKAGASKIVLFGGLALSAGMLAASFLTVKTAWLMYLTYGIIGGFGVGAAYNAIITAAQKWFPQKRGFATGVSVCAFGFSTVIFAPLIETLIKNFGVKNTFLILTGVFLIVVLALFKFIKFPAESAQTEAAQAELLAKKQFTVTETIRTKEFYFITLSLMFATAAFFILNPSFKTLASDRGLDASIGTVIVMMTGVANALGRLGAPLLSDKLGRERAAILIIGLTAAGSLLLCFVQGFSFMATIAVIAFCYGGFSGMYPVLTADYFGIKNVGSNYGAVMIGFAVSALTFPIIISQIQDIKVKFIVLASLAVAGAILVVLLKMSKKQNA